MSALILHRQLQKLFIRDGLGPPHLAEAPLADDIGNPTIIDGIASTGDRDLEHCRFAPRAFGDLSSVRIPLLYDHEQPAGTIDRLSYDASGRLLADVTATHATARRCVAFSVGARVREYTIIDNGRGDFEAFITHAELTDLSLVRFPVNPQCKVLSRRLLCPQAMFYELMRQRLVIVSKMLAHLQEAYP